MKTDFKTIDEYIDSFPPPARFVLEEMRNAIREVAPGASEKISYQIPTFHQNGNLVHFAAYETHFGFYPGAGGVAAFKDDLKGYKTGKGSIQFPIDKPVPLELIKRIVKYRVGENQKKRKK